MKVATTAPPVTSQHEVHYLVDNKQAYELLERNTYITDAIHGITTTVDNFPPGDSGRLPPQLTYRADNKSIQLNMVAIAEGQSDKDKLIAANSLYRRQLGAIALYNEGEIAEPYVPVVERRGRSLPLSVSGVTLLASGLAAMVGAPDIYKEIAAPLLILPGVVALIAGEPKDNWIDAERDQTLKKLSLFDDMWQYHYPDLITIKQPEEDE